MTSIKFLILSVLILLLSSCGNRELKTERTTQANKAFFQKQLYESIGSCQIKNDTVWLKNSKDRLNTVAFWENTPPKKIQLQKMDTLFAKPTDNFAVYFILRDIQKEQLTFAYQSQFNFNTFSMKKEIIDVGDLIFDCER